MCNIPALKCCYQSQRRPRRRKGAWCNVAGAKGRSNLSTVGFQPAQTPPTDSPSYTEPRAFLHAAAAFLLATRDEQQHNAKTKVRGACDYFGRWFSRAEMRPNTDPAWCQQRSCCPPRSFEQDRWPHQDGEVLHRGVLGEWFNTYTSNLLVEHLKSVRPEPMLPSTRVESHYTRS